MTLKPNKYYKGKISGEFKLTAILNVNGQPVFVIDTLNQDGLKLNLEEMREEKPKAI